MGGKNSLLGKPFQLAGQATGLIEDKTFRQDPTMSRYGAQAAAGLSASASGAAPSIGSMQYAQALQDAAQMAQAQAASARGVNPALAQRAATQATQVAAADAAQQSAILAAEERRRAQEILLGASEAQRVQAQQGRQFQQKNLLQTISAGGQAALGGGAK